MSGTYERLKAQLEREQSGRRQAGVSDPPSGAPSSGEKPAKKGRLELVLDEFSEVHGTVLLGMHKELQTLKDDVRRRVEEQISQILTETRDANAELRHEVSIAQEVRESISATGSELLGTVKDAKSDTLQSISQAVKEVSDSISAARAELLGMVKDAKNDSLQSISRSAQEAIARVSASDRSLIQQAEAQIVRIQQGLEALKTLEQHTCNAIDEHLAQSKRSMDAFSAEASRLRNEVGLIHKVANDSISDAKTSVLAMRDAAEKLLTEVRAEREALHRREAEFQRRTRKIIIAVGIVLAATIGAGIWLSMKG